MNYERNVLCINHVNTIKTVDSETEKGKHVALGSKISVNNLNKNWKLNPLHI